MHEPALHPPFQELCCFLALAGVCAPHGVRWIDPSALHLTLRFLGATTPAQRDFLLHMLPMLAQPLPAIDAHRFAIWPGRLASAALPKA